MGTKPQSGITINYTDPNSGITIENAWVQITNILYVPATYCLIVCDVYKDEQSYNDGMSPVFPSIRYQSNYNDSNWNSYFDASIMDAANKDIQKQSVSYLQLKVQEQGKK